MRIHKSRRRGGSASVSIHVRDLGQMFNSFDPSPFWDRDLDRDAAGFIEDEFSDKRSADNWHLHVYAYGGSASAADLQAAIERYYERLVASTRLKLREQMRVAEIALLAGIAVFSICISLREILQSTLHGLPLGLDEGLLVLAWIALWRPIEMLAYGWLPLYRQRRLYGRLARVQVSVRAEPNAAHDVPAKPPASSARSARV